MRLVQCFLLALGVCIFSVTSSFAQTEENIYLPSISTSTDNISVTHAVSSQEGSARPCQVVNSWFGNILCNMLFIVFTAEPEENSEPTPTPTPTPIPIEVFNISGSGVETVQPWNVFQSVPECKWTIGWRHCQIQVKFDLKKSDCKNLVGISLRYTDDVYRNARINIEKFWADNDDYLWLQFYRLAYDYSSGLEGWRYTATLSCESIE